MKKGFLTCGGGLLVVVVLLVVIVVFTMNTFLKSFDKGKLKDMGFESQAEFDAFSETFSKQADTSSFPVSYQSSDLDSLKSILQSSVALADSSPLYLQNGLLNVSAFDKENNGSLLNAVALESHLYACFLNFVYQSVLSQASKSQLSEITILSYTLNTAQNHSAVLKLDTQILKESLKEYGKALPGDLYIQYNYDILYQNDNVKLSNVSLKFNELSEQDNATAMKFLDTVLASNTKQVFADILQAIINSFSNSVGAVTLFSETLVTMEVANEI